MATCYCKDSGNLIAAVGGWCGDAAPCKSPENGEIVQCCGAQSSCGPDGFCFFWGPTTGNNVTGYYMGGCTDPTYQDPACPQHCTDQSSQDVVYLQSSQKWACCRSSASDNDCNDPSDDTFDAPAPYLLAFNTSMAAPTSTTAAATMLSSTTPAGTFTAVDKRPTSTTQPANGAQQQLQQSGTPASTIALATVLAVVAVALIGLGLLFWLRWRKQKKRPQYRFDPNGTASQGIETSANGAAQAKSANFVAQGHQMPIQQPAQPELGNSAQAQSFYVPPSELDATPQR